MSNKKVMIEKTSFERGFLDPIKSFVPKTDFFPLYFIGEKLVSFCSNRQENGTIALYLEHTPDNSNMVDGDVFYIREPLKLLNAIKMIPDDRIVLEFNDHQIMCKTKSYRFKFALYDKELAKRDKLFWKPEKFNKIRDSFTGFVDISKDRIADIKNSCNLVESDLVTLENTENGMSVTIGSDKNNSVSITLPPSDDFDNSKRFIKNIFLFLGKHEVELVKTRDDKVVGFIEKDDENTKYYIVTTKAD